MIKRALKYFKIIPVLSVSLLIMTSCGGGDQPHEHHFKDNYSYDNNYHWNVCFDCEEIENKEPHTFGEWQIEVDADYEHSGQKSRGCTICDYKETETIPIKSCEHKEYGKWEIAGEPTLEITGLLTRLCLDCSEKLTYELPKLNSTDYTLKTEGMLTCTTGSVDVYEYELDQQKFSFEVYHAPLGHEYEALWDFDFVGNCAFVTFSCKHCDYHSERLQTNISISGSGLCTERTVKAEIEFDHKHYEQTKPYEHSFSTNWETDACNHWHQCTRCDAKKDSGEHQFVNNKCEICDMHTHLWETQWNSDETYHWHECAECEEVIDKGIHVYAGWENDEIHHWKKCTQCNKISNFSEHEYVGEYCECGKMDPSLQGYSDDGVLYFQLSGDKTFYNVSGTTKGKNSEEILIPKIYNGKPVKVISAQAFFDFNSLLRLTIPNTIEYIGSGAFNGCSSLTSIVIPESVTIIGLSAFSGCSSLTSITLPFVGAELNGTINTHFGYIFGADSSYYNNKYVPSSLKEVIITGGSSIGVNAFSDCSNLTSIVIPESVTSIGVWAFSNCSSLTSIVIPNSVTSIGNNTFLNCSSLVCNEYDNGYYLGNKDNPYVVLVKAKSTDIASCEINNNTKFMYKGAFSNCSSLTSITLPFVGAELNGTTNSHFGYIFGDSSYDNNRGVPSSLKEVIIAGGTSIGEYAFSDCNNLTSIVIPDSVTSIGDRTFQNCSSLTSIVIPKSVTSIGYEAFQNCSSLTSIVIPNSVTSIGNNAFKNCNSLTSIVIPNSVTNIGYGTFSSCSSLSNVYYEGTIENWCKLNCDIFNSSNSNHFFLKNSNNEWKEVTKIEIPNTITEIGASQFSRFNNIESITIPENVTNIGYQAFYKCSSLTNVTIGNSVTDIGYRAFYDCSSLTSIIIPKSVTNIDSEVFSGCSNLSNVYYEGTIENWCKLNCDIFNSSNSNHFFLKNSNNEWEEVTKIEIPNTITEIEERQFLGFNNVTSIIIPESVTIIGNSAFAYCSSLTSIVIPNSVTSIGNIDFSDCSSLTSIVIPNSVTSIGYRAFYDCSSLTSITIPNSVTSIGIDAFENCSSLANVYYGGTIENWCKFNCDIFCYSSFSNSNHFYLRNSNNEWEEVTSIEIPNTITEIGERQFLGFNNVTSIIIPESVTNIGNSAFQNCSSLTSIVIPNSVTDIEYSTFSDCSSLTSITIPKSVTSIGDYAFSKCNSLTSIDIPNNVTSIGDYAFEYCNSLTSIDIPNNVISIGHQAFYKCSSLTNVTIGNSVTSIGVEAFFECSSLTSVVLPKSVTSTGGAGDTFNLCSNLSNVYYEGSIEDWCNSPFNGIIFSKEKVNHFYLRNSNNEWEEVTRIEMPNTITEIRKYQFYRFNNIESITIPESVTTIGYRAFYECSSLTNVTIGNSVTNIDSEVFSGCSNLSNVYYEGTIGNWCKLNDGIFYSTSSSNSNHFYLRNSNNEWEEVTSIEIPNTITEIVERQFLGFNNVTSITIPESVTNIGSSAFSGCSSLTSITLPFVGAELNGTTNTHFGYIFGADSSYYNTKYVPSSLKEIIIAGGSSIGVNAFEYCSNLTSIVIPESVTTIGYRAFYECSSLTNVTIGNSVTNIDSEVFSGCSNLSNVYYEGTIEDWCNGSLTGLALFVYSNSNHFFLKNSSNEWEEVTSIEIPNTITEIGERQFLGFNNVTSITIPESVTNIGSSAFSGCSSLTSITLPFVGAKLNGTTNTHFGYIFGASSKSENNKYVPSRLKEVIITRGTSIGVNAFWECSSLTSIVIPNSVTSIGEYAFWYCSSLTSIVIPNSVTSIGHAAFGGCSSVTSIVIPDSVTNIGGSAFSGCSSVTSIVIPDNVTSIGQGAFGSCSSLTSITLPFVGAELNGTTNTHFGYIFGADIEGSNGKCVPISLKEVIITGGTSIGTNAFHNCSSVTSIVIPNSVTDIGYSTFSGCSSLTSIVIPNSVTSIGYEDFSGCSNLSNFYYNGTSTEWANVKIGDGNSELTSATICYYSETEPTETGNYWHYVDGVATKW